MIANRLPDDDEDVMDMHVARILAMTPEELRAETIANGEDPDEVAERVKRILDAAFAEAKWRAAIAAAHPGGRA